MRYLISCLSLSLLHTLTLIAQVQVDFDTANWNINAQQYELTNFKGQRALMIRSGSAILEGSNFENGIVEWDMAFPEQRGFCGIRFRVQDSRNSEEFYFRPHQSGMPDANQYCPVNNGISSWQLYHSPEYSVPYEYNFDKWFHVKLVVAGQRAEVYIDNMRFPILHIPFLKRESAPGKLMVYGAMVPTYFANFSYTLNKGQELLSKSVDPKPRDPMTIENWIVSDAFPDSLLKNVNVLDKNFGQQFNWQVLKTEDSGLGNLAKVADFDRVKRNAVFAKIAVMSDSDQIKPFHFGFSDKALVYCNGQIIFGGNDAYVTRDYRYLGTIGYFDTVYLPLVKGRNEIRIAVTENFGGWGIQGKWSDTSGIRVLAD